MSIWKTQKRQQNAYHWIMEVTLINPHIIHTMYQREPANKVCFQNFKRILIEGFIYAAAQLTPEKIIATLTCQSCRLKGNDVERVFDTRHLVQHAGE